MKIANYQGKSWISRVVRWVTRSVYSHTAFVFDEMSERAALELAKAGVDLPKLQFIHPGAVCEAWASGLRNVASLSSQHTPGTVVDIFSLVQPLSLTEEMTLVKAIHDDIGDAYDFKNVLRFVTRRPGSPDGDWFCSEWVFQRFLDVNRAFLLRTAAWEVPPGWIARSLALSPSQRIITI